MVTLINCRLITAFPVATSADLHIQNPLFTYTQTKENSGIRSMVHKTIF